MTIFIIFKLLGYMMAAVAGGYFVFWDGYMLLFSKLRNDRMEESLFYLQAKEKYPEGHPLYWEQLARRSHHQAKMASGLLLVFSLMIFLYGILNLINYIDS